MSPTLPQDGTGRVRTIVFTVVVASFSATTLAIHRASSDIDALSDSIVSNSAPTIERLASLRGSTSSVQLALWRYLQEKAGLRSSSKAALDAALTQLNADVQGYLALPRLPGEQRHWDQVRQAWLEFDDAVKRTRDLAEAGIDDPPREAIEHVEPDANRLVDAAMSAIEFNAKNGRLLAARVKETRRRANALGDGLSAFCVVLAAAGAVVIDRDARNRRALVQAYSKHVEARAAELEQFAGRVAHDIRNPVGAAQMVAELVIQRSSEEGVRELGGRIVRSLARANAVTTGLLDFARSGANPDPGARADVREAIANLAGDVIEAAERAGIDLRLEALPPVFAACSPGVYLSMLSNLVWNAIKYMGDASVRRISVRVTDQGSVVRTEVIDTGPGIAAENLPSLFVPYFRGQSAGREGLGLGLATVKKLAEGHGGQAGVHSVLGQGSTFWFTLPRAGTPSEPVSDSAVRGAEDDHPHWH